MFSIRRSELFRNILISKIEVCSCSNFSIKKDPGIRKRKNIIEETHNLNEDDLDYEADFASVQQSHRQHMKEMEAIKERLQYSIVQQKYFKEKYPNFLTWHEKEQIRLLHKTDPEKWTVEKLSEGFPALPEVVIKILKSNWRKENLKKIKNHDRSVQDNWAKFRNNEMSDLPSDLTHHLKKFSGRKMHHQNYEDFKENDTINPVLPSKYSEFSDIIRSYQNIGRETTTEASENKDIAENFVGKIQIGTPTEEGTYIQGEVRNKRLMTLDALRNKLKTNLAIGSGVSYTDAAIVETEVEKDLEVQQPMLDDLESVKYNTGKLMVNEKKIQDYNHLVYPQKIKIPKKILKRGSTYKLNDCYYDSDGLFLYRVPGMY